LTVRPTLRLVAIPPEVYADAQLVLASALAGDTDQVVGTFDSVVARLGMAGAYDLAWCLAATMVGADTPTGSWTLDFPGIDEAKYDARWVARFVSAYANADQSTAAALFGAAMEDGQLPECLLSLVTSAVATLRRRAA
jgi:hypothetical protein